MVGGAKARQKQAAQNEQAKQQETERLNTSPGSVAATLLLPLRYPEQERKRLASLQAVV
jgi:hypothetical protein